MKKKISLMLAFIIVLSTFFCFNISAYGQETIELTDTEIECIVNDEFFNVIDEVLYSTSDMYFVNDNGYLEIIPSAADTIISNAVKEIVFEKIDVSNQNNLIDAFLDKVTIWYNELLDYYNEQIKEGILCVTSNGTLYESSDNEACVQGGNVTKTVRTVGVYYHFYNKTDSKSQSTKYYNGYLKAKKLYDNHKDDPNWRMSDSEFEDIMSGFADDFGDNWAKDLVMFATESSVLFAKNKMNRDYNVSTQITNKNKAGYGTIVRINAARAIQVAAQTSSMTYANAKNDINSANFVGPYKLFK